MHPDDKQFFGVVVLALIAVILLGFQYLIQNRDRWSSEPIKQESGVKEEKGQGKKGANLKQKESELQQKEKELEKRWSELKQKERELAEKGAKLEARAEEVGKRAEQQWLEVKGELEEVRRALAEEKRKRQEAERLAEEKAMQVAPAVPTGATWKNSIGMEFVLIPAGDFEMGCSSDSEDCDSDEKPRHSVRISRPFYLGKYEVTQAQWKAVMGNNPSRFKGPDRPVENVSWNDVQEFVKRVNAKEGHTHYRLPTEAEWEYAARAGSTTAYSFGNDKGQLGHYAWYRDNSGEQTHPVGQKHPNTWGLYDIHGNVWEWVEDWYGNYSAGAVRDPKGPNTGEFRVLRGGSWLDLAGYCRSARRFRLRPDDRFIIFGLRLALFPGH